MNDSLKQRDMGGEHGKEEMKERRKERRDEKKQLKHSFILNPHPEIFTIEREQEERQRESG